MICIKDDDHLEYKNSHYHHRHPSPCFPLQIASSANFNRFLCDGVAGAGIVEHVLFFSRNHVSVLCCSNIVVGQMIWKEPWKRGVGEGKAWIGIMECVCSVSLVKWSVVRVLIWINSGFRMLKWIYSGVWMLKWSVSCVKVLKWSVRRRKSEDRRNWCLDYAVNCPPHLPLLQ